MGRGTEEHRDRSKTRNEEVDNSSESSSDKAPSIIVQELKRYKELYNEHKVIIVQLQKQNDEILKKLRASESTIEVDPSSDTNADPLTDTKKSRKRNKKEKQKQARDESKAAKVSEHSFVHDNRYELIAPDEKTDTQITLPDIPEDVVINDDNVVDFEEIVRRKNRKKREDYPSLPKKLP